MGKIVAAEYVSVDGVMQDPGGVGEIEAGGWTNPYWNDELAKLQTDLLFASDALLLGRVTYEGFAAAWPDMEHEQGPFAGKMNAMPKYVASRTLTGMAWNAALIEGDVAGEAARLKRDSGRNLLIYGSGSLVRLLLQHGLIDQLRLMIYPVVLGAGKPLFTQTGGKKDLQLAGVTATRTGVVVVDYKKAPSGTQN
ncbi:MAG TPA: dihydrofolate reductase family protein [Streptosporangiaceae bacterium]|nr:dihydrofolate reductase family protein [Streptosporangiaceae bacterium]